LALLRGGLGPGPHGAVGGVPHVVPVDLVSGEGLEDRGLVERLLPQPVDGRYGQVEAVGHGPPSIIGG
jgi:hypothetical protein